MSQEREDLARNLIKKYALEKLSTLEKQIVDDLGILTNLEDINRILGYVDELEPKYREMRERPKEIEVKPPKITREQIFAKGKEIIKEKGYFRQTDIVPGKTNLGVFLGHYGEEGLERELYEGSYVYFLKDQRPSFLIKEGKPAEVKPKKFSLPHGYVEEQIKKVIEQKGKEGFYKEDVLTFVKTDYPNIRGDVLGVIAMILKVKYEGLGLKREKDEIGWKYIEKQESSSSGGSYSRNGKI